MLLFQRIICTYYIYDHYVCIEANSEYTSYFIQRKKESKHKQNKTKNSDMKQIKKRTKICAQGIGN